MAYSNSAVYLLFVVGLAFAADHQIPSKWGTCKRSDPKFEECVKSAFNRAIIDLQSGNAELGLPSLDPFIVNEFRLKRGGNGPLNIDMVFSEVEISDTHTGKVNNIKVNLKSGEISAELMATHIDMRSRYKVRGRVLLLPIHGEGRTVVRMDNVLLKMKMRGHIAKGATSRDHYHVDSFVFDMVPEKSVFKFVNPAHAAQADLLSRVVSENDKSIMNELRPSISESFSKTLGDIAKKVFTQVAIDDVFPH